MCILIFLSIQFFLIRPDIDTDSKGSGGGGGVRAEFSLLIVRAGARAELLGSPGGWRGGFLFLTFGVLADLPLFFGGMGMYLGLGVMEVFT